MPQYTYQCPNCKTESEFWHGMTDNPSLVCDKCIPTYKLERVPGGRTFDFGHGRNTGTVKKGKVTMRS